MYIELFNPLIYRITLPENILYIKADISKLLLLCMLTDIR